MKSWKIDRPLLLTEKETIIILANSAGIGMHNPVPTHTYTSLKPNGQLGFYSGLQLDYDETISYEQAIEYLKTRIKERVI